MKSRIIAKVGILVNRGLWVLILDGVQRRDGYFYKSSLPSLDQAASFSVVNSLLLKKIFLSPIWWESLPSEQPKVLVLGRGSLFLQLVV